MSSFLPLRFAKRKVRATELTPAERRALAPRPPVGAQVRYLALVDLLDRRMRAAVERHLYPLLPEIGAVWGSVQIGQPDRPAPLFQAPAHMAGVFRQDGFPCGMPLPAWYTETHTFVKSGFRFVQDAWVNKGDDRFEDAFDALQAEIDEITAGFQVPLTSVAHDVVRSNVAQSGELGGSGAAGYQTKVAEFVRKNVALVKSVQAQHLERLEQIIHGAQGDRVEALQAELQQSFALPKARAALIARDQVLKLNSQVTQERQAAAGIDTYIWTTTRDERVRGRPGGVWSGSQADHWILDGTRQKWAVAPVTNPITGSRNHPGEDFQCRCTALPDVERILRPGG